MELIETIRRKEKTWSATLNDGDSLRFFLCEASKSLKKLDKRFFKFENSINEEKR